VEGEHQQAKIEAEPLARAFGFAKRLFGAALENVQFRLKFGLRRGRHSVDEKNPPEVIKFMLDGPRKQPAASECRIYHLLVVVFTSTDSGRAMSAYISGKLKHPSGPETRRSHGRYLWIDQHQRHEGCHNPNGSPFSSSEEGRSVISVTRR